MKTNKKSRIAIDALLIILGIVFLIFGIKDFKNFISNQNAKISDAERFKADYQYVNKDNSYKYTSIEELKTMLNSKEERIILLGSPLDPWTQVIVSHLDEYAKSVEKSIYYLELDKVDKESEDYKELLKTLKIDELYLPTIVVQNKDKSEVLDKTKIYDSNYTEAPIDYWTEERIEELKRVLSDKIEN